MSPQAGELLVREIMPIILGVVPRVVQSVGIDDQDELIQDGLALAAQALDALERQGKQPIARSVAFYVIQRLKSGRRSQSAGRMDALCTAARLDGKIQVVLLNEPVDASGESEELTIGDMLAAAVDDPSTIAAREVDWDELDDVLSERERTVLHGVAEDRGTGELARQCRVSAPAITQTKRRIGGKIRRHWGDETLSEISRTPLWKSSLQARRECAVM